MKTIKVVTSSSMFGDTTESISYLTSGDKRELEQQDKDLDNKINRVRAFAEKQNSSCETAINELKFGVCNTAAAIDENLKALSKQINNLQGSSRKKGKELSESFVNRCHNDVMKYFEALAEHAKTIEAELSIIQKEKSIIEEQLKVSSAIASFFLELYKEELSQNSDELRRMKQLIENMTAALAPKNEKKHPKT